MCKFADHDRHLESTVHDATAGTASTVSRVWLASTWCMNKAQCRLRCEEMPLSPDCRHNFQNWLPLDWKVVFMRKHCSSFRCTLHIQTGTLCPWLERSQCTGSSSHWIDWTSTEMKYRTGLWSRCTLQTYPRTTSCASQAPVIKSPWLEIKRRRQLMKIVHSWQ